MLPTILKSFDLIAYPTNRNRIIISQESMVGEVETILHTEDAKDFAYHILEVCSEQEEQDESVS